MTNKKNELMKIVINNIKKFYKLIYSNMFRGFLWSLKNKKVKIC